jgi:hypothetical protein
MKHILVDGPQVKHIAHAVATGLTRKPLPRMLPDGAMAE